MWLLLTGENSAPTPDHSTRAATIILPGEPGNLVTAYPEG